MAPLQFENQEREYLRWLAEHPHRYVLSTYSVFRPDHIRLHLATCRLIRQYMRHMAPDAFTGRQFKKICSNSSPELYSWAEEHGYPTIPICKPCNPQGR